MSIDHLEAINSGYHIVGNNTQDTLNKVWKTVSSHGIQYLGQRGLVRSIKGVTLVIENPLDEAHNFPFWDKKSDDLYQDTFVRKETNNPPEVLDTQDHYPYKYVDRSRFYDFGFGYTKGVLTVLENMGLRNVDFKNNDELSDLLRQTYQQIHPERVLGVLFWHRRELMDHYLNTPWVVDTIIKNTRADSLQVVIEEIKNSPSSRRAVTPNFIYQPIDHSGVAGGVPVYQSYQLYTEMDPLGKPTGLISFHLHRALDAFGGAQLDISHDRNWGETASKSLGLPLKRMFIYANDLWGSITDDGRTSDPREKGDIRDWLFSMTDGYDPKTEDIERRLSSEIYQRKITAVVKRLQDE